MSKQEQIKTIREACIKANPEIVKLKFGCLITFKTPFSDTGVYQVLEQTDESISCVTIENGEYRMSHFNKDNIPKYDFEIIGRPIRLSDVLLAIPRSIRERLKIEHSAFGIYVKGHELWNLLKDNLEDQSDETISFIHSLLTNN